MGLITDALLRLNERKGAAGIPPGGTATFDGNPALRYAILADTGLDQRELERVVEGIALQSVATVAAGVPLANALGGTWLDGILTGITIERIRLERLTHRRPYVGEGADGARRSAQIDREEADTLKGLELREAVLASASRWDRQALALDAVACIQCGHRLSGHTAGGCTEPHPYAPGPCPCPGYTTREEDLAE